jgi:hypothetical protein
MKDVKKLGRLYKEKNPGVYDDLSDEEVGQAVLAKFPEEYSDFNLDKPSVQREKFSRLEDKAEPDTGAVRSWWRRRKVESLTKLQQEINTAGAALNESIRQETLLRQNQLAQGRADAEERMAFEARVQMHKETIARSKLSQRLIKEASKQGMSVETLSEVRRKLELDRLDLEKEWKSLEQQLRAGFIYQMQAHQHLTLITEYIGGLYDRAKRLQVEGKDRELKLIEEHIAFMEADFRGRQRLLQAANAQDVQTSDSNSSLGGDSQSPVETDTSLR